MAPASEAALQEADSASTTPSVARLLAAGQKGETLSVTPFLGATKPANIPGKGRGLVARSKVSAGDLLLLEPALASAASYADLAAALVKLLGPQGATAGDAVVSDADAAVEQDDVLLAQLMSLSAWGEPPASVPAVEEDAGLNHCLNAMRRSARAADKEAFQRALKVLGVAELDSSFYSKLTARLELVARSNAFRSAVDPLGAIAWHALAPREQQQLAAQRPESVPVPIVSLFLRASLFNHSERPNASWMISGGVIAVRAAAEIQAGQEVLISYWPDVDAADALVHGFYDSFGGVAAAAGCAAQEHDLTEEQLSSLQALKKLPYMAASTLAEAGAGGDVAAAFQATSSLLNQEINRLEKVLPQDLRAFLEPRCILAQVTLQQAAVLAAGGDAERSAALRKVGMMRLTSGLQRYSHPWDKRVLLRLIHVLKGALRPAPLEMLKSATDASEGEDFVIGLARQARPAPEELRGDLEKAVASVFGEEALVDPLLGKCGISE
eukprot:TRINITY_DN12552_c0_g1_i1.p1 TRINITY_DN12552_c0_g1~~TRINITY_DN12552_c0_g1_i1.p1  ORF type:complete len:524 (-),score=121.86 TRINITY_DN12552_c0_g1_i1:153-1643(-)